MHSHKVLKWCGCESTLGINCWNTIHGSLHPPPLWCHLVSAETERRKVFAVCKKTATCGWEYDWKRQRSFLIHVRKAAADLYDWELKHVVRYIWALGLASTVLFSDYGNICECLRLGGGKDPREYLPGTPSRLSRQPSSHFGIGFFLAWLQKVSHCL